MVNIIISLFFGFLVFSEAETIEEQPKNTMVRKYCGISVSVVDVTISKKGSSPVSVRQEFVRDGAHNIRECYISNSYHTNKFAIVGSFEDGRNAAIILTVFDYMMLDQQGDYY